MPHPNDTLPHNALVLTITAILLTATLSANAQTAYFAFEGVFTDFTDTQQIPISLSQSVNSTDDTFLIQTFHNDGGTNAAGDTISPGSFSSELTLFDSAMPPNSVGSNVAGGPARDALLSWPGIADSGTAITTDPLPAGGYSVQLEDFPLPAPGLGPWAVDIVAPASKITLELPASIGVAPPTPGVIRLTLGNGAQWNITTALNIAETTNSIGDLVINDTTALTVPDAVTAGLDGTGTLTINTGATVSGTFGNLGAGAAGNGTATIAGTWNSSQQFTVADAGAATLNIDSGGTVNNSLDAVIGSQSGSHGTATVNSGGSWDITTELTVADAGTADLTINTGGTVDNDAAGFIARSAGSTGTANLDGGTWDSASLYIGGSDTDPGGNGTLNVNGGSLNVTGTLKRWNTGTLNHSGGTITLTNGSFERPAETYTLSGTANPALILDNSTFDNGSDDLEIGSADTESGSLTLNNASTLTTGDTRVGTDPGSAGTATINAGTWNSDNLYIGGSQNAPGGNGTLSVNGGAVNIDGTLKLWDAAGTLNHDGGTITITNGSFEPPDQNFTLSGTNNPTLTLDDTTFDNGTNQLHLATANAHSATLNLNNGASLTTARAQLATDPGATATATIDDSQWTLSDSLDIGVAGTANLNINSDATVTNTDASIATNPGATGTATLNSGTWNNASLYIGGSDTDSGGDGTLNVNGGNLNVNGTLKTWPTTGTLNHDGGTITITNGALQPPPSDYEISGTNSPQLTLGNSIFNHGASTLNIGTANTQSGSLTLNNNSTLTTGQTRIGHTAGSTGAVTVHNGQWTLSDTLDTGFDGGGSLIVNPLGTVTVNSASASLIGANPGSTGTVTVNGGALTYTDALTIGHDGTGLLTVGSGSLTNADASIGSDSGPAGTATVNGGTWNSDNLYVGGTAIAAGGDGTLNVNGGNLNVNGTLKTWPTTGTINHDGGAITITNGAFQPPNAAFALGGSNNPTLILDNATFDLNQKFVTISPLGLQSGSIVLNNGSTLTTGPTKIGGAPNSTGSITINHGQWALSSGFTSVGLNGAGSLTVNAQGTVTSPPGTTVELATSGIGTGSVNVNGGSFTVGSTLIVGRNGPGTLDIDNGGTVNTAQAWLGQSPTATGTATLNSGTLNANSGLYVGGYNLAPGGTGTLNINGGNLNVTGTLKLWEPTATLNHDGGTITITNGTFEPPDQNFILSGTNNPELVLDNSSFDNGTEEIQIGNASAESGTVTLDINTTMNSGAADIGLASGSTGTATINSGQWTLSGPLDIGVAGTGTLTVNAQATVTSNAAELSSIGRDLNSSGTVTVDGGSLSYDSGLELGRDGSGTLRLYNGGTLTTGVTVISNASGGNSSVTIDNGQWTLTDYLSVGRVGVGELIINTLGSVTVNTTFAFSSIAEAGGEGTVTVNGGLLTYSSGLRLGSSGTATLNINNGGTVTNQTGVIVATSDTQPSTATVNTGTWNNHAGLIVGGSELNPHSGPSTLNIHAEGLVNVTGTLKVWEPGGTVNLLGGTIQTDALDIDPGAAFNFPFGTLGFNGDATIDAALADHIIDPGIGTGKTIAVADTATLLTPVIIDGGTFSVGGLINPGLLDFRRGTLKLNIGTLLIQPTGPLGGDPIVDANQTLRVNQFILVQPNSRLTLNGGRIESDALQNNGTFTGSGTVVGNNDALNALLNLTDGVIQLNPADHLLVQGNQSTNQGRINLLGGTLEVTGTLTNTTDALIIGSGALQTTDGLTNHGTAAFAGTTHITGDVTNAATGLIASSGGGPLIFFDPVDQQGEVRTSEGGFTVFFSTVNMQNNFTGPGTVNVESDVNVGASPGVISFEGNLAFGPAATLHAELGGLTPGPGAPGDTDNGYDQITVTANAALAGTLDIQLINNFETEIIPTDVFTVMTWGTNTSATTFDTLDLDSPATPGLTFTPTYNANDLTLTATALFGDANLDGVVDILDLVILAANFDQPVGTRAWRDADFNLDTVVDATDLQLAAPNFTGNPDTLTTLANSLGVTLTQPTPEPVTLAVLVLGVGTVTSRRPKRRAA